MSLTPLYQVVLRIRHIPEFDKFSGERIPPTTDWRDAYHLTVATLPRKGEIIRCETGLPQHIRGTYRVIEIVHLWPNDEDPAEGPHAEVHVSIEKGDAP